MSQKGKQVQSTSSHMDEPHQTSHHSADDEDFLHDQLDEIFPESPIGAERPPTNSTKRQYWMVQVRNSEGEMKERPIRVRDIYNLAIGEQVVIPFDGIQPSGTDADGLLGGFLGRLAQDKNNFPISFEKWSHKEFKKYKDPVWDNVIKAKLWWDPVHEAAAKMYIMKDIGKKWRDFRIKLFNTYYDPTKSLDENCKNPPLSIPLTEWAAFLDYRLRESTKEICKKNAQNRSKLTINHTGGSKKLKRRRVEIMSETGQSVSRGTLYIHTHKRADGSYINEEARVVCEKISEIESQGTAPVAISPNDSLGQVFGKEHSGRVRGVGDGVCPSQVFGSSNPRFSGLSSSTNTDLQNCVLELKNEVQELRREKKEKDEETKIMARALAQLLKNSSMPIPPEIASHLNDSQSTSGPSSSQSDRN